MLQFVVHLWDKIIFVLRFGFLLNLDKLYKGYRNMTKFFSQVYLARAMSSIPKAQRVFFQLGLPELFALGATDDVTANLAQAWAISFLCNKD